MKSAVLAAVLAAAFAAVLAAAFAAVAAVLDATELVWLVIPAV
jgi:hypothetical protein